VCCFLSWQPSSSDISKNYFNSRQGKHCKCGWKLVWIAINSQNVLREPSRNSLILFLKLGNSFDCTCGKLSRIFSSATFNNFRAFKKLRVVQELLSDTCIARTAPCIALNLPFRLTAVGCSLINKTGKRKLINTFNYSKTLSLKLRHGDVIVMSSWC